LAFVPLTTLKTLPTIVLMETPPEGEDTKTFSNHPNIQSVYPTPTSGIGAQTSPPASTPSSVTASPADPNPVTADQSHNTHDSTHILQWLTFMFWGLTVLALAWLTASVFTRLIAGEDTSTFNYYLIASLIILFPCAFVCDMMYVKQEPEKKIGASSRIMAAYSIIFALFGLCALLGIAWNIVAWATGSGLDHSSSKADIVSGLFIFFYYLATFMRTLNPIHAGWIPKTYRYLMLGVIVIFVILGFTKPTFNQKAVAATGSSARYSFGGSGSSNSGSNNNIGPNGKLEPSVVGGTQCDIPVLSDGSTTGQVALFGGATCSDSDANIQAATGKNGGNYTANGFTCTSTKQGP